MAKTHTINELESMTWNQLADLAKKRGMSYSFAKAELVARLSAEDAPKPAARRRTRSVTPETTTDYVKLFKEFTQYVSTMGDNAVVVMDDDKPAYALIPLHK